MGSRLSCSYKKYSQPLKLNLFLKGTGTYFKGKMVHPPLEMACQFFPIYLPPLPLPELAVEATSSVCTCYLSYEELGREEGRRPRTEAATRLQTAAAVATAALAGWRERGQPRPPQDCQGPCRSGEVGAGRRVGGACAQVPPRAAPLLSRRHCREGRRRSCPAAVAKRHRFPSVLALPAVVAKSCSPTDH